MNPENRKYQVAPIWTYLVVSKHLNYLTLVVTSCGGIYHELQADVSKIHWVGTQPPAKAYVPGSKLP